MQRALPLVASFCSAWTGGPDPLSRPAADRPPPDPSGAASLLPSRVPGGIAVWDRSTWRSTASGHLDALEHTTAAPRTVPLRTYAVGTPEAPGHAVRVWRHVRWPHTHPCFRALASEAARQCARGPAGVAPGSLTHKRELTALSPCPTPSSCRLWPSVRACTGSLFQPGSHGGFLMPPTPWPTAEKAVQTGEARLETGLRPPALHLLPQRLQPQPAHQPTAHHDALG